MGGATVIGPILTGVDQPIQICSTGSTVNDILNMAVIAACRLGQTA
jgi:malate dehydrogenase (oxaloacetate-decarboxylating)(NADP+)